MNKNNIILIVFVIAALFFAVGETECAYPPGFLRVVDVIPDVVLDIRYAGENNFIGSKIDGYEAPEAILSVEAAVALKHVADSLREQGYTLKIFDAYRPASAVKHFVRWGKDLQDTKNKKLFYPNINKNLLFREGYISSKSSHSAGWTVDLTLVHTHNGEEVDMGSPFDFFGTISNTASKLVTPQQAGNRRILSEAMKKCGFSPVTTEWWHFRLIKEPYRNAKFDFPVTYPAISDEKTAAALNRISEGAERVITAVPGKNKGSSVVRAYKKTDNVWTLLFTTDGFYNSDPAAPGKGSSVSLFCSTGNLTAGSVSVPEAAMFFLLTFIDEKTKIVIEEYEER